MKRVKSLWSQASPIPLRSTWPQGQDSPSPPSTLALTPVGLSFLCSAAQHLWALQGSRPQARRWRGAHRQPWENLNSGFLLPDQIPSPAGRCAKLNHESFCPSLAWRKTRNACGILGVDVCWKVFTGCCNTQIPVTHLTYMQVLFGSSPYYLHGFDNIDGLMPT